MYCKNCGNQIINKEKFCKVCGTETPKKETFSGNILYWIKKNRKSLIIITTVIFVIAMISVLGNENNTTNNYDTNAQEPLQTNTVSVSKTTSNQNNILPSVVNIICQNSTNDKLSGGSGTIMNSKGTILTNSHIIPQDYNEKSLAEICIITLPDEKGQAKEIYYGKPLIIPDLSSKYDLAFININGVYTDDTGITHGTYPQKFRGFLDTSCENDNVTLGEAVRVFGYPSISGGGYYLTITDGVVSSILKNGTIITSAKIDHGNSGGIAVDENGCFIGVPSAVEVGEMESLGMIIPNNTILDFVNELSNSINGQ